MCALKIMFGDFYLQYRLETTYDDAAVRFLKKFAATESSKAYYYANGVVSPNMSNDKAYRQEGLRILYSQSFQMPEDMVSYCTESRSLSAKLWSSAAGFTTWRERLGSRHR